MAKAAAVSTANSVVIPELDLEVAHFTVHGTSPIIVHAFSQKAKEAMLAKQMGKATGGREKKSPVRDFVESLYWLTPKPTFAWDDKDIPELVNEFYTYIDANNSRFGFPAIGFKSAMVTACTSLASMTKVAARQSFHINEEYVEIKGRPEMREDMVRISMGTADLRYRPQFSPWTADIPITFNKGTISREQVANILNVAGFAVGVGDYRPERDGQFGRFTLLNGK